MNDNCRLFLKVISIILIIFGTIATIVSIIALINLSGSGTSWVAGTILLLISSLVALVVGIIGLKKSEDPSEANFFIITGFIIGIMMLISLIMSFSIWNLIGFVLPVLYIIGGYMQRRVSTKIN